MGQRGGQPGPTEAARPGPRALLRREQHGYVVEAVGPAGRTRTHHSTLVGALNADPPLRQLWRPARSGELAAWGLGTDVLYIVPG